MADVLFGVGLVCLLVGLGLAVGWGWGLAATGGILIGFVIFVSIPAAPPKIGK